jgi:hypothetical protein
MPKKKTQTIPTPEQMAAMGWADETDAAVIVPLRLARLAGATYQLAGADAEAPPPPGAPAPQRREYGVTFIQAGYVKRRDGNASNWRIPPETLQKCVDLLASVPCFVDHAGLWDMPSLRNLAGVTFEPAWNSSEQQIDGGLRLYQREDLAWLCAVLDQVLDDQDEGREVPDIGLSLSFFGRHDWIDVGQEPGEEYERVTTEITHVESCDLVFGPGANGRIREILSMAGLGDNPPRSRAGSGHQSPAPQAKGVMPQVEREVLSMPDELQTTNAEAPAEPSPAPTPQPAAVVVTPSPAQVESLAAMVQGMSAQIEHLTQALAAQAESRAVQGMGQAPRGPRIGGMLSSVDQIALAYEQLMGLPVSQPVHRLSGIRELYILLTGDRDFQGRIDLDLVPQQLAYSNSGANADTTTMAELTRNVMAKVLVQQLDLLTEYQWWRQIARVDNMNSLQQVSWVRYGGIGYGSGTGLPTVAEKGEYQQLYWEDERTTGTWVKKGGYLPLSLEMIDRDDLMGWRDVPRQLALAEAVTLSSTVSALFTDNSGAGADLADAIGDGYAFNTTRGNLITQPLNQDNWDTAVDTMYKLSQLKHASVSESRRIAARPKFLLVPIELESSGITAVRSEAKAGTLADRRAVKRILPEENVVTVPHWTNTDNWAALADPALVPFAGVAFRFGEQPEIFMPGPDNHVLWLNDVLPIKVRWFFAVGVIDPRGAIKSNVS